MTHTVDCRSIYGLSLFQHLDDAARAGVAARFEKIVIERGRALVEEGEPADSMYVVLSGRFSVTRCDRDNPISEIGAAQAIGEIGFLTGSPRTATVTALRDSIVFKLNRQRLEAMAESDPRIWRAMSVDLAARLAATTLAPARPRRSAPRTIALIPAGGSTLNSGFIESLTTAFAARAPTLVVDSHRHEFAAGNGAALADSEMTERLNALEANYTYVLMIADAVLTAWTRKIIHHADLVLAAGEFNSDPTPNDTEVLAARFLAPASCRLALLHDTRRNLNGTQRWLAPRSIAMHHHVARDEGEDFARLVRFIDGTARGLVLAGGGALCVTHIGVHKALVESGYSFDIMGGTSGGSAMAAAFLLRSAPEDIDRGVHEMFVERRAMHRYTLPRYSLLDHTHFDRELRRLYGEGDIEDLWLPFFAVSTNLSRYGPHVHSRGPLWKALRASASIPVMLPPVYTELGEMLVDGSLVDNVPVEAMHGLKYGPNVVVAFNGGGPERFEVVYEELPSRTALLRLAMTPWARKELPDAPGLASVLMRSLMANRHAFRNHLQVDDLLLVPPIPPGIGFLDWHRHGELMDAGYRWARATLQERTMAAQSK
jgi:NTE family protein